MGLIDTLFRRNRKTKADPVTEFEPKHRVLVPGPSANPARRKQAAKRKARKQSKASRKKNRR